MVIEAELKAPCLLVAVPQLVDPNFNRGVVMLIEHNDSGSMGLVLNRPSDLQLGTFCASQNMVFQGDDSGPIYQGGPVQQDRAFILHASKHEGPETENVFGDTRLSYSLESLKLIVDDPPPKMRIFLGYAGWGPDQLATEVTSGAWLLGPPNEKLVFDAAPSDLWELALRDMGIEPGQLVHSGALH